MHPPRPEASEKQILRLVAGGFSVGKQLRIQGVPPEIRAIDRPSWAGGRTASLALERGIPGQSWIMESMLTEIDKDRDGKKMPMTLQTW